MPSLLLVLGPMGSGDEMFDRGHRPVLAAALSITAVHVNLAAWQQEPEGAGHQTHLRDGHTHLDVVYAANAVTVGAGRSTGASASSPRAIRV